MDSVLLLIPEIKKKVLLKFNIYKVSLHFPSSPYKKELRRSLKNQQLHISIEHSYTIHWKNVSVEIAVLHLDWFNCLMTSLPT